MKDIARYLKPLKYIRDCSFKEKLFSAAKLQINYTYYIFELNLWALLEVPLEGKSKTQMIL
eukprot:snap_masked-scaffold_1-processed-gene-6.38-mRNA-1 protein AED:1.00 eAED:1.00 QI:0/0/0/0/1/1/2/0/60